MRFLIPLLILILFFQNCGESEFDLSTLPNRPYKITDAISFEGVDITEGQSQVILINPKITLTETYFYTWELVPQSGASLSDFVNNNGHIQIGPGQDPFELTLTTNNNAVRDGTRRFILELTLELADAPVKTSAEIFVLDND